MIQSLSHGLTYDRIETKVLNVPPFAAVINENLFGGDGRRPLTAFFSFVRRTFQIEVRWRGGIPDRQEGGEQFGLCPWQDVISFYGDLSGFLGSFSSQDSLLRPKQRRSENRQCEERETSRAKQRTIQHVSSYFAHLPPLSLSMQGTPER